MRRGISRILHCKNLTVGESTGEKKQVEGVRCFFPGSKASFQGNGADVFPPSEMDIGMPGGEPRPLD